jgi:hypothetical protein
VLKRGETVAGAEKGRRGAQRLLMPGGEKGRRNGGGGLAVGVPRGAGVAWGLAPTGGRRPDRVPVVARTGGASLFGQWRGGTDAWALAVGGRGSEKREARRAWAGPEGKRVGRAQMNSMILDLFKLIQTCLN